VSVELSVVVPVCNEAENVEPLAREIDAALQGRTYEMIFVDDGSTDETAANLRKLKSSLPALRVLSHSFRSGQSAAVASGARRSTATARTIRPTSRSSSPRGTRMKAAACGSSWVTVARLARTRPGAGCSRGSPTACAAGC
jgi:cellulose synthase/poly-beta-1,6-N-acetylglucosamine synthase-like glycosyltransferase